MAAVFGGTPTESDYRKTIQPVNPYDSDRASSAPKGLIAGAVSGGGAGYDASTGIRTYADGSTYKLTENERLTQNNQPAIQAFAGQITGNGLTTPSAQPSQAGYQPGSGPSFGGGPTVPQAATWSVTPQQTVEQRAADIAKRDSPLMQQARGAALQQSNERGLINSSLGVQAAQDAVLTRAIDVAKQDAATAADAGKFNVNQSNSWNLAQQELAQKGGQFQQELNQRQTQFDKDMQFRYDTAKKNNENALIMADLENKYRAQLQNDSAFNQQYQSYVNALLVIDQNRDLDAPAKQALKYEQAKILETYAAVRGLGLNLDFSSQYKNGVFVGTGPSSGGGDAGVTGPPSGVVSGERGGPGGVSVGGQGQSTDSGANQGIGLGYVGGLSPAWGAAVKGGLPGVASAALSGNPIGLVSAALNGLKAYNKKDAEAQASAAISNNANAAFSSAADSEAANADGDAGGRGFGYGGGWGGAADGGMGLSSGGAGGGGYADGSGPGGRGGFGGFGAGGGGFGTGAGGAGGGTGGSGD